MVVVGPGMLIVRVVAGPSVDDWRPMVQDCGCVFALEKSCWYEQFDGESRTYLVTHWAKYSFMQRQ